MSEWQIYSLHDPRTKVVHYVGVTEQPLAVRFAQHLWKCCGGTSKKRDWIRALRRQKLKPIMRRLAFFEGTRAEAECAECAWMELLEAKFGAVLYNRKKRASAPELREKLRLASQRRQERDALLSDAERRARYAEWLRQRGRR